MRYADMKIETALREEGEASAGAGETTISSDDIARLGCRFAKKRKKTPMAKKPIPDFGGMS